MSGLAEGQKFRKTALKVIASSIRKGNIIEQDGRLYVVLTAENIHPGKGTPVSQIEMRRIGDGVKVSERYKTTDQVEKATVEDRNFNYLYEDADGFHFMNNETYDQIQVPKDVVGGPWSKTKNGMCCDSNIEVRSFLMPMPCNNAHRFTWSSKRSTASMNRSSSRCSIISGIIPPPLPTSTCCINTIYLDMNVPTMKITSPLLRITPKRIP